MFIKCETKVNVTWEMTTLIEIKFVYLDSWAVIDEVTF